MKTCPKCGVQHDNPRRFCSISCAHSRERPQELRERLSLANKGHIPKNKGTSIKIVRKCLSCDNTFLVYPRSSKHYCCNKCNPNLGGYREGSGRAKTGYYKGIYCGSTYELAWVIYQLDHSKHFQRFEGCLETDGKKYYPDFLQDGKIIEIKGYENQDSVDRKTKIAEQHGFEVVVLRKEDLQKEFEWVTSKYDADLKTLYDGYKPSYVYRCCDCSLEFAKDKKAKTERVFCSRECAGRGNGKVLRSNQ